MLPESIKAEPPTLWARATRIIHLGLPHADLRADAAELRQRLAALPRKRILQMQMGCVSRAIRRCALMHRHGAVKHTHSLLKCQNFFARPSEERVAQGSMPAARGADRNQRLLPAGMRRRHLVQSRLCHKPRMSGPQLCKCTNSQAALHCFTSALAGFHHSHQRLLSNLQDDSTAQAGMSILQPWERSPDASRFSLPACMLLG